MTRRYLAAATALACFAIAACDGKKTTPSNSNNSPGESAEPGAALFERAEYRKVHTGERAADPITVPMASVVILRKVDVPSRVDGTILWVGFEVDNATAAKLAAGDKFVHPRDKKVYRRLLPGDWVKQDQLVAILDDEHAFIDWEGANVKAEAAKDSAKSYGETVVELRKIVQKTREGVMRGVVPEQEEINSRATLARYQAEKTDHEGSAQVAASDEKKSKYVLDKHILRSAIEGQVQQILKQQGDGVKGQEPVMVIHDLGRLRAIGNLPKEYVNVVARGDEVSIEVPRDVAYGDTFTQHTTNKAIIAVAVAVVDGKPVIISAAEDGWVWAWDRDLKVLAKLRQPVGVRSLAVTRPGAPPLLLIGGIDGTARLYDLANPTGKAREFEGRHDGGVSAAAFSPDGRYCVTADERGIYMYDVTAGKRMYTFPAREHHSPITALHFTPQGRVVSAGKEPSIRVWVVGKDGARVEHRIDSRSGEVPMPGVTDDGSRLLLDADKSHLDVIHLEELRKERPLVTGESIRFSTFTAWSPELDKKQDNRLVATTGAAEGVVQLWRAPTAESRGSEVARLMTRGSAAAMCAAFSPQPENGFLVVGTRKGDVHVWPMPSDTDVKAETLPATVTHVDDSIESSGRTVNVLVDFDNPPLPGNKHLLRPGSAVSLVIRPKK
jgi:WD domain, G-beta repeat